MATRTRPRTRTVAVEAPVRDWSAFAFYILRTGFTVAPILFGIDKFFNLMVHWPDYLWAGWPHLLHVTPERFMYGVGVIEIVAGLVVLLAPRIGSLLVAGWLGGIITNLVIVGVTRHEYWDIALRDFGLMLGALALFCLAMGRAGVSLRR